MVDNLRLVGWVVAKLMKLSFFKMRLQEDDAIQAGNMGLMNAAELYNPAKLNKRTGKPYAFSTFAVYAIHRAVQHEAEDTGCAIRVSRSMHAALRGKVYQDKKPKEATLERARHALVCASLDETRPIYAPEAEEFDPQPIRRAMEQLVWRDRWLLRRHYWDQLTCRQIGGLLGLTTQRAQQMLDKARRHLREILEPA